MKIWKMTENKQVSKAVLNRLKEKNDMIKKWETELVKIKYTYSPTELEYELKELNKKEVIDLNLRQIKNIILGEYTGEVELIVTWVIGENTRQPDVRFSNIDEYENYIKSIDECYDSIDAIFNR